jgi:spectinomycin phosphotransferase
MIEKPPIADDELLASVRASYGLPLAGLEFLPLGADSFAAVYRGHTEGGAHYFLKLRLGELNPASLLVPRFLHESGVANVVAPLPARADALWAQFGPFALTVYPFIEGATALEQGLSAGQWATLGAALRQIHALRPPPALAAQLRRESFWSAQIDLVAAVAAELAAGGGADPIRAELAELWREREAQIAEVVRRARALSGALKGRGLPLVLCHADFHTANMLVARDGLPWIVDWDEVTLAPPERDLMFVTGGGISEYMFPPGSEAHFRAGYGPAEIDREALAYYRCAWAAQDIGEYGAQAVLRPDVGDITRREAVRSIRGLFGPGEIVATALGTTYG